MHQVKQDETKNDVSSISQVHRFSAADSILIAHKNFYATP